MLNQDKVIGVRIFLGMLAVIMTGFTSCAPKEKIVLREIKDVVVDATSGPKLKARAIFYNPNNIRMKLRGIKVDVIIDGKKRAEIDQDLSTSIPARGEFSVPLEVNLAMKELGLLDTVLGMLGGKEMQVNYKGALKLTYHGFPVRVPVDHKEEVRIRF